MKTIGALLALLVWNGAFAQAEKAENLFVITTDGLRWQEVFEGADSALLRDPRFVADTALAKQLYWHPSPAERRQKLLPFFWLVLSAQGQLYGNRTKDSRVRVRNIYKISYPGYNELLTGYADPLPVLNAPQWNRNLSVLEFLERLPVYAGKVAAFSSWNVFPFILNRRRNPMLHNSAYEAGVADGAESTEAFNNVQDSVAYRYKTRYDALTFFQAKNHIQNHHPKVVFLALGETDEFAHQGRYDLYLQQAAAFDRMLAELWYLVQTDPVYRNKTAFVISTDHGRGNGHRWTSHHSFIAGSGNIWLALLGKGVPPLGERTDVPTVYQNQVAATIGQLLGERFESDRKTGKPIALDATTVPIAGGATLRTTQVSAGVADR